ncbi:MAG TPA: DUF2889 domain-containing protein [Syntrophobacter fumaroxidans]|nr:DUF2889 domain-containing protein [Syntrophobacter fumaroxidans]
MDIFQRSIHLNAKKTDDDHMQVAGSLLDLEHSFHLELTVRISTHTIVAATASMSKAPLTLCYSVLGSLDQLKGLSIERGIIKEIRSRLGGPKGCTHLIELLNDALRFTSMLLIGEAAGYGSRLGEDLSEEEIIAQGKKRLRNTCFVFADEQEECAGADLHN